MRHSNHRGPKLSLEGQTRTCRMPNSRCLYGINSTTQLFDARLGNL
jgi:hypothetical protein